MTTLRVDCLADLVPVLPYLLGFVPERSLVLAGVSARRIAWVQRTDLVAHPATCREAVAQMLDVVDRERPDSLVAVAYERQAGESRALLAALQAAAPDWWEVTEVAAVRGGLVHDLSGADGRDAVAVPVAPPTPATRSLAQPAASREERVASTRCRRPSTAQAVEEQVAELLTSGVDEARVLAAWRDLAGGSPPGDMDSRVAALAIAAAGCADVAMRDALIWALSDAGEVPPGTDMELQARVAAAVGPPRRETLPALLRVCQDVDGPLAAELTAVAAAVAWQEGDGVLAAALVDRVLEHVPGHRLAGLVGRCVALGVTPERVPA